MAVYGLEPSFGHVENGMTRADMEACLRAANELNEVIIFRSTGPWSRRWLERGYPSKNFHVKGKSSDWGPQAGFVPYLGMFSKVGHTKKAADEGTEKNQQGLDHHFAAKVQLELSEEELQLQLSQPEENPPRKAIDGIVKVPDSNDLWLIATRPGPPAKQFVFRAERRPGSGAARYLISYYREGMAANDKRLRYEKSTPLEVMTSSEVGAKNKPMTGDYDLMAVCALWGNVGERVMKPISKPGLDFAGKGLQPGQTFMPGADMDKVLDMRSNTGAVGDLQQKKTFQGITPRMAGGLQEHGDMGNLTPRILRCVNTLNRMMVNGQGPFRRVHHNAESHRNHIFGALTEAEMQKGDGLPITAFHPPRLRQPPYNLQDVVTLESLHEFKAYAAQLHECGYFVPRNWTWGMSIRNTHQNHIPWR